MGETGRGSGQGGAVVGSSDESRRITITLTGCVGCSSPPNVVENNLRKHRPPLQPIPSWSEKRLKAHFPIFTEAINASCKVAWHAQPRSHLGPTWVLQLDEQTKANIYWINNII